VDWVDNGDIKKAHKVNQSELRVDDRTSDKNKVIFQQDSKRFFENEDNNERGRPLFCSFDQESRQPGWILLCF
jgi:hypothetical protein